MARNSRNVYYQSRAAIEKALGQFEEQRKADTKMINARMEILSKEVLSKCKSKGIEVYILKKSKANTIAFTSNYRKRREFEITFLKDSKYRISTRFLGYKKAMLEIEQSVFEDNDPDGRRKRFNVDLYDEGAVNRMIGNMLEHGYSEIPDIQRCL